MRGLLPIRYLTKPLRLHRCITEEEAGSEQFQKIFLSKYKYYDEAVEMMKESEALYLQKIRACESVDHIKLEMDAVKERRYQITAHARRLEQVKIKVFKQ